MRICLISLGCDKNLCDSEAMLGLVDQAGYEITDDMAEADAIIINSCAFIGDAKEESISVILEAAEYKKRGHCKVLIVTGCLSQRYNQEFFNELPEVDGILGTASFDQIVPLLDNLFNKGKKPECFLDINLPAKGNYPRILSTGGHYAYMKIAEGCNKKCGYCVIPSMRGNYRSVPMEELIKEAETLANGGVKELILVAQETTLYGTDLYGKKSLPLLLEKLSEIEGIKWIRILYCYPEEITDELIEAIANIDKVVKYLDIPIQSASDDVLRKMGRVTTRDELEDLINKLRKKIPSIALRTTLICGFPGESEDDHKKTLDFVRKERFERLGAFAYSKEDGTKAALMDGQIDESVKEKRRDEIMSLQQKIVEGVANDMIGKTLDVFVEGEIPDESIYVGRSYMDAPDVDGYIFFSSNDALMSGDIVKVKITEANIYDLVGEVVSEHT